MTRGQGTESSHTVGGVIVGIGHWEELRFGHPEMATFWRSSMKPFQALPVVEDGAVAAFGFEAADLALCCASHHGTPTQVERVRSMLSRLGLTPEALACAPHLPFDEEAARQLLRLGEGPTPLHNNCSGKHTAMLALALHHGWETAEYNEFDHSVQERIRSGLRRWLDLETEVLSWAVDGCGVPTPYLSLRQMARAYARLGRASVREAAPASVVTAMTSHPSLVGGPCAFSTRLMRATAGRLLAKEGAEGVFCVAAPSAGWGAALKISDGAKRAVAPALIEMLIVAELLEPQEIEALSELRSPPVTNWQGREVGRIVAEVEPQRATMGGRI